jgi:hypothetical protein
MIAPNPKITVSTIRTPPSTAWGVSSAIDSGRSDRARKADPRGYPSTRPMNTRWKNPDSAGCSQPRRAPNITPVAAQLTVKVSGIVQASPQRVFDAMTDPEQTAE